MDLEQIREKNIAILKEAGFDPIEWLPVGLREGQVRLRSREEIARRILALNAVFQYVVAPNNAVSTTNIRKTVDALALQPHLTSEESEILDMPRADAVEQHERTIGWKLENIVALCWVMHYKDYLPFDGAMVAGDPLSDLIFHFLPPMGTTDSAWIGNRRLRSLEEVVRVEDLFYCCHNAVRLAQRGHRAVPKEFQPHINGLVIQERRHALTWSLSPGVDWERTDVSTLA